MGTEQIDRYILSIDCAIAEGSVVVMRGNSVLASSTPDDDQPSRAERVLGVISDKLHDAQISFGDIDTLVVSRGPGSYSGIRIGIATAMGLAGASSLELLGVSALDGIALCGDTGSAIVTAVGVGKHHVAWCPYQIMDEGPQAMTEPATHSDNEFASGLRSEYNVPLFCPPDLAARLDGNLPKTVSLIAIDRPIAELAALFAVRFPARSSSLSPIYLRDHNGLRGGARA